MESASLAMEKQQNSSSASSVFKRWSMSRERRINESLLPTPRRLFSTRRCNRQKSHWRASRKRRIDHRFFDTDRFSSLGASCLKALAQARQTEHQIFSSLLSASV